jgi:hypothetical protein
MGDGDVRIASMVSVTVVDADKKTKEELLGLVDSEVEKFSDFMAALEDWRARGALNSPEKALLRTYLIQKIQGRL